jgi:ribose transport system ATP-binding protein
MTNEMLLAVRNVSKAFPGVQALAAVDFDVRPGEVHVLLGENGAGKSTLVKILSGVYRPDEGHVLLRGERVSFENPHAALQAGIATVYQEFSQVPDMTVAQNIYLGQEPMRRGFVDRRRLRDDARRLMVQLDIDLDPDAVIRGLGIAHLQIVDILRALAVPDFSVLILDEPTAALSRHEIDVLFRIMRRLKERGVGLVYISHRLEEIDRIGDRVTVFRDGHRVVTEPMDEVNSERIIEWMVGRPVTQLFPERSYEPGEELLRVEKLTLRSHRALDVSFSIRRGETVGVFGLIGAGRTETARGVFGLDRLQSGYVEVAGDRVTIRRPRDAVRVGLGLAPEDRKYEGVLPDMSVAQNICLASMDRASFGPFVSPRRVRSLARSYIDYLRIATPSTRTEMKSLSGGNQQKCVLARLLAAESNVLLLDEPTRGIDVGAKAEVYALMNQLTESGKAILMISSDLPEVMGMSDRVVVFRRGRVVETLARSDATETRVMRAAVPTTIAEDDVRTAQ